MPVTLENISTERFTEATIRRMYRLIDKYRTDAKLQDLAAKIVRDCPWKDYQCFGDKLLSAVKSYIPYTPDPFGIERIQSPWDTLKRRAGDCDDYSVLLSVLGAGVGFDIRLVTIKAKIDPLTGKAADQWSHVYVIMSPPNDPKWYGADAVMKDSYFGWEASGYEKKVWEQ